MFGLGRGRSGKGSGEEIVYARSHGRRDHLDTTAVRLLEYAPYREIVRLMGFRELVSGWPEWRGHIRSESRKRGLDFLAAWLPEHHPELV
jgi:hypothetical protein